MKGLRSKDLRSHGPSASVVPVPIRCASDYDLWLWDFRRLTTGLKDKSVLTLRRFRNNARRDSLGNFWSQVYGSHHGIIVVNSFFENVPIHLYERRELAPGERETNTVLHFQPRPAQPMTVACLWSHWTAEGQPDLHSFAAITDDPPPEIAATGHQRCIISLRDENLTEWLTPTGVNKARLEEILTDRAAPYYEHQIAA